MEKGWFRGRLTQEKSKSPLWCSLADAIENLVLNIVEPFLKRIDDRKSFYSMDSRDLDRRIEELGQFFALRTAATTSKPLLLTQRLDEIHLKDTDQPLINTFWREFEQLNVSWKPIWAPADQHKFPYGTFFLTDDSVADAGDMYGEMFLTSRGTLSINLADIYRIYGFMGMSMAIMGLLNDFDLYITPLLPTHIVFDGVTIKLEVTLIERPEYIWLEEIESNLHDAVVLKERHERLSVDIESELGPVALLPVMPTHESDVIRYDDIPADVWITDIYRAPVLNEPGVYMFEDDNTDIHFTLEVDNENQALPYSIIEDRGERLTAEAGVEFHITANAVPETQSDPLSFYDVTPADILITDIDYIEKEVYAELYQNEALILKAPQSSNYHSLSQIAFAINDTNINQSHMELLHIKPEAYLSYITVSYMVVEKITI